MNKITFKKTESCVSTLHISCPNCGHRIIIIISEPMENYNTTYTMATIDKESLEHFKKEVQGKPIHCRECLYTFEIE